MKLHFLRDKTFILVDDDNNKLLINPYFGISKTPLPVSPKDIMKSVDYIVFTGNIEKNIDILTLRGFNLNKNRNKKFYFMNSNDVKYFKSLGFINTEVVPQDILHMILKVMDINLKPTNGEIIFI